MRVLHLSTNISPSSAYTRLHLALREKGIDSKMLYLEGTGNLPYTYQAHNSFFNKVKNAMLRRIEVVYFRYKYPNKEKVIFSTALYGNNIIENKLLKEADIIHLHWINSSFITLNTMEKILNLGKPIIWSVHDSWPFTGGCHVKYGCLKFQKRCGECPMLHSRHQEDISRYIFIKKEKIYANNHIFFITPSIWMHNNVKSSGLFKNNKCFIIPNTLNLCIFRAKTKQAIEKKLSYVSENNKIHLLFGAVTSTKTGYKGFDYLLRSLEILKNQEHEIYNRIVVHVFGADRSDNSMLNGFELKFWGTIRSQETMACLYSMADAYVFPSIDDNLPSTVMESLACETPVIAFEIGGVPDMVQHLENGYLAEYKNEKDLCQGIIWVIRNNKDNLLGKNGRKSVTTKYRPEIIVQKHIEVYNKALGE